MIDRETEDLKHKAIKGSLWATIEKFSLMVSQFIIGIVLARLLEPGDFGLIALTTVFITISSAIVDGGFETAMIQNSELSDIQINTSFYVNLIIGCLMTIVICLLAPYISVFFNEPRLVNVLRVLSLMLPLEGLGQTQRTLLMKALSFKKISIYQIVSSIISGIFGIILAYNGFGVWALVYSTMLALLIRVIFLWIGSAWYPRLIFSYRSIAKLIPFGLNVLAMSILYFLMLQFNTLVIGRYYKERELGFFNRGMKFPDIVISIIQSIILKMSLPVFSKIQNQSERLNALLQKTNNLVAFLTFPLLLFFFLNAKEIVLVLLTFKWLPCVIYFKFFCVIKLLDPFISIQRDMLLAKGKSRLSFRLSILTSIVEAASVLIFAKLGIIYIVYVALFNKILQYLVYLFISNNRSNIILQAKSFISYFTITIFVVGGVQLLNYGLTAIIKYNPYSTILIDVLSGGGLYFGCCTLFRIDDIRLVKGIAGHLISTARPINVDNSSRP